MDKVPGVRTTDASKLLATEDEDAIRRYREQRRPQLFEVEGTTRDRVKPEMDKWDLSCGGLIEPTEHYNDVGPDRQVTAVNSPERCKQIGVPDELADFLRKVPGAKVVTKKADGANVQEYDAIMVSYPREIYDDFEEEGRRAAELHDAMIDDTGDDRRYALLDAEYNPMDRKEREDRIRSSINAIRQSGLAGPLSKTEGMSYQQALSAIPHEDRIAEEARLRRGTREESHADEAAMKAFDKRVQDFHAKGGKKTMGGLTGKMDNWTRSKDAAKAGK